MLVIGAVLIALGVVGMITTGWFSAYGDPSGWASAMMGGGMMGGGMMNESPMRGMMNQMMPDLVPPGLSPEDLPDPKSEGAQLLTYYCTQCHNLPSPSMHAAEEWPAIADRMFRRMLRTSRGMMMSVEMPNPEEQRIIVGYLESHGMKSISPHILPSPETKGAVFFREFCSQCHALPDPKGRTSDEWPAVVQKMRGYMQSMDKRVITREQEKEIVGYLERNAKE